MPFDTTYHIYPTEGSNQVNYIVPFGKDTVIELKPGEYPPSLDPAVMDAINKSLYTDKSGPVSSDVKKPDHFEPSTVMVFLFIVILAFIAYKAIKERGEEDEEEAENADTRNYENDITKPVSKDNALTYYGDELDFSNEQYDIILTKHFPYYNALAVADKEKFIHRLDNFIHNKTFTIYDSKGFKEMPVLISATAVQLTFGLQKYLLTNFEFIHVYPQEFMRINPTICFLEGNVSGHTINLSWKHFLEGIHNSTDGKNVGLHEMAHALYYQTFVTEENVDINFRDTFNQFNNSGNKVYHTEQQPGNDLYSDYAMKNFQEFWAETIELFFETPVVLKNTYPVLYDVLSNLLNQDPGKFNMPSMNA